jgi:hypothetical protein
LSLASDQAVSPGAALKIELADTLILGEVVYCRPRDPGFYTGIALEQALYHTRDLAVLGRRLLGIDIRSTSCDREAKTR